MNKKSGDGGGRSKVYSVMNAKDVSNMVVTGTGNGGDLLEKNKG